MDYKSAGVDRAAGDAFVDRLQSRATRNMRPEILGGIGGFGGHFVAPSSYKEPVFVATTDGVGTKLMLAEEAGKKACKAVGQDVVAMCVNDLIACGAEPLIFLDYLATGRIEAEYLDELMTGIMDACDESGCSLIGGETAEMPGYYPKGRFDVAGFSIGVVEKNERMKPESIAPGDIVLGLQSSGFHSNGYSLVRKVMSEQKWTLDSVVESETLGDFLLRPTRLYVREFLDLKKIYLVKGAAHITGGGIVENLPRCFGPEIAAEIRKSSMGLSHVMKRFVEVAELSEVEAYSTWNMGIGFCIVVSSSDSTQILKDRPQWRYLGQIAKKTSSDPEVVLV